jgi:hypothetical protein
MSNSCHSQVHTYLGALSFKIGTKVSQDILAYALSYSYYVLGCPCHLFALLLELGSGSLTNGTGIICGKCLSLINISAYGTYKFLHIHSPSLIFYL